MGAFNKSNAMTLKLTVTRVGGFPKICAVMTMAAIVFFGASCSSTSDKNSGKNRDV
ncbi:hypothetical protein MNBD_NITROSPINAE04-1251, partial [hydrothermal vent metagenome]